jgi:hypothetical protein
MRRLESVGWSGSRPWGQRARVAAIAQRRRHGAVSDGATNSGGPGRPMLGQLGERGKRIVTFGLTGPGLAVGAPEQRTKVGRAVRWTPRPARATTSEGVHRGDYFALWSRPHSQVLLCLGEAAIRGGSAAVRGMLERRCPRRAKQAAGPCPTKPGSIRPRGRPRSCVGQYFPGDLATGAPLAWFTARVRLGAWARRRGRELPR